VTKESKPAGYWKEKGVNMLRNIVCGSALHEKSASLIPGVTGLLARGSICPEISSVSYRYDLENCFSPKERQKKGLKPRFPVHVRGVSIRRIVMLYANKKRLLD
jgi:hypothetical protein